MGETDATLGVPREVRQKRHRRQKEGNVAYAANVASPTLASFLVAKRNQGDGFAFGHDFLGGDFVPDFIHHAFQLLSVQVFVEDAARDLGEAFWARLQCVEKTLPIRRI